MCFVSFFCVRCCGVVCLPLAGGSVPFLHSLFSLRGVVVLVVFCFRCFLLPALLLLLAPALRHEGGVYICRARGRVPLVVPDIVEVVQVGKEVRALHGVTKAFFLDLDTASPSRPCLTWGSKYDQLHRTRGDVVRIKAGQVRQFPFSSAQPSAPKGTSSGGC